MRFLITGGAGFIGSHLCDELLAQGHRVDVLDDLSTGSMEDIAHLRDEPRFTCTVDSARHEQVVAGLVAQADKVIHLAAAVGVELIVQSPVRTIETNVHCIEVVLAQAASSPPGHRGQHQRGLRQVGRTALSRGRRLVLGATTTGRWAYACSKAIDEFLAIAYWTERRHPTIVARLFNTVGPRQTGQYGMVVPRFVRSALAERDVQVYGDGTQTRCFCHVQDVVAALVGLVGTEDHGGRGVQYRIGGGDHHRRARRSHRGADQIVLGRHARTVRGGLRGGLRGHRAARARHDQDPGGARMGSATEPRRRLCNRV